jgi:SagB-type dehydrogenase family enzyme
MAGGTTGLWMDEMTTSTDVQVFQERLSLGAGVYSVVAGDGTLHLVRASHSEPFGRVSAELRAVLRTLAAGPCSIAELRAVADNGDHLPAFLQALSAGGWLMTTVCHRGRRLYTVEPIKPPGARPAAALDHLLLSRFAVQYSDGGDMVLESPLAWGAVRIHDPAVAVVPAALARPQPAGAIGGTLATGGTLPDAVAARLVRDLRWTGLAVPVPSPEDGELRLRQWGTHELWFHACSRGGLRNQRGAGLGRTMWARGRFDPLPARRVPFEGPAIDLYRPDLDALRRDDPPLSEVLEDRRSCRVHDDDDPITVDQLGELLYRCARVREAYTRDGVDYLRGPRPSGSDAYELEIYPVIRLAAGVRPGMYHYDAHEHRLRLVRGQTPEVGRLIKLAARTAQVEMPPQVLLVIAARFGRVMWGYQGMPYSLILKHVGVLYQCMYLVATSMGLAACGLGGGDTDMFAEATGLDYATEGSVGEFILGSQGGR